MAGEIVVNDKTIRNVVAGIGAAFLIVASSIAGCHSYKIIPPKSFGVDVKLGSVQPKTLSAFNWKWPLGEDIYVFSNNAQTTEFTVGNSSGANPQTADRNFVTADIRIIYTINPDAGIINYHLSELRGDQGASLIQSIAAQSHQAVVGPVTASQSLSDPQAYLSAFQSDFMKRLALNNVAVVVKRIELLGLDANIDKPLQLRYENDGNNVMRMVGPAAMDVTRVGGQQVVSITPPARSDVTVDIAPKPAPSAPANP